jgi:hypothetical protein
MLYQWLMIEHSRLHTVEAWPESAHRRATLAAVLSAIKSLSSDPSLRAKSLDCTVCCGRKRRSDVIELSSNLPVSTVLNIAA